MNHKLDVLYVHGYNGSGSGETAMTLEKLLDPKKYNLIRPDFSNIIADVEENIREINEIVCKHSVGIIIGNSLGTFQAMNAVKGPYKILINPVFDPVTDSMQMDIFDDSFDMMRSKLSELANNLVFDLKDKKVMYGFFGALDDVVNCQAKFEKIFGAKHMTVFPDVGHKLFESQLQVVVDRIDRCYYQLMDVFDEFGSVKKQR